MPPVHRFFLTFSKYLSSTPKTKLCCLRLYIWVFAYLEKCNLLDIIPIMVSDSRTDYNFQEKVTVLESGLWVLKINWDCLASSDSWLDLVVSFRTAHFIGSHSCQLRLRLLNTKYPTLPIVRIINGQMAMSIPSWIRFLLMVFPWRVKTKCSWSRLVRLSSWCITWRWPLDKTVICSGNKPSNKVKRQDLYTIMCNIKEQQFK